MKFYYIILILITLSVASCKSNPKSGGNGANADTIVYSYKEFKIRDKACGDNPDNACTIIKLNYPDFDGRKALNDSITAKFIQLFAKNPAKETSREQLAADFISRYNDFKKINPNSTLYFLLDGNAKVLMEDRFLMTLEVSGNVYNGGPHGVDCTGYINWNIKKNKTITLDNILDSNYRKPLTLIAEQIFRKNEKLSDTSSLNNGHTYFFKDGKFSLPDEYSLTNYGIQFLYNVNTIKPFAAGKTYLLVPYDHIRPLIKPHFGFTKNG